MKQKTKPRITAGEIQCMWQTEHTWEKHTSNKAILQGLNNTSHTGQNLEI